MGTVYPNVKLEHMYVDNAAMQLTLKPTQFDVMLTTFGMFWGAEGAGVRWPGNDASILGVLAFVLAGSLGLVGLLRQRRARMAVAAR